jgi:hypothetical protein
MLIFEKPAGFPNFWVVVPGQRPWCTATRGGTSSTALQYYSSCSILRAENKVKLARRLRTFLTPPLSLMTTTSSGELSRPCQHRRKLRANLFIATLSFASARRPHSVLAGGLSHMPLALFKLFFQTWIFLHVHHSYFSERFCQVPVLTCNSPILKFANLDT